MHRTLVALGVLACASCAPPSPDDGASPHEQPESGRAAADAAPGAEALLRVRVRAGEAGAPLAAIPVELRACSGEWSHSGTAGAHGRAGDWLRTDAEGAVEFVVPAGEELELRVNRMNSGRAGSATESVAALAPGENRTLVVPLAVGDDRAWFGRVVDGAGGAPLPGASALRTDDDPFRSSGDERVACDADGRLALPFRSYEASYARIEHPGYAPALVRLARGHEEAARACIVRLWRPPALAALVLGADGAPRAGVELELSAPAARLILEARAHEGGKPSWQARTDRDGRCELMELPPGVALTLTLSLDGQVLRREERALRLAPGEVREETLTVGTGCTVRGRALDAGGHPASGVRLWLVSDGERLALDPYRERELLRTTRTRADGGFELADVPAGSWALGPAPGQELSELGTVFQVEVVEAADSRSFAPAATALAIAPGQREAELTLVLQPPLTIRGRVVGPADEAVEFSYVVATQGALHVDDNAQDGRFSLGPLPPGAYRLSANNFGGRFADCETVTVEAGKQDVVLRLRPAGSLRVRVTDAAGRPAGDTRVSALHEASGAFVTTWTEDDGSACFDGLLPGAYSLSASTPAGECARAVDLAVAVQGAPSEATLRLTRGARLTLRLPVAVPRNTWARLTLDGRLWELVRLEDEDELVVAPGTLEIELSDWRDGRRHPFARRTERVAAGDERVLELELQPDGGAPR